MILYDLIFTKISLSVDLLMVFVRGSRFPRGFRSSVKITLVPAYLARENNDKGGVYDVFLTK